MGRFASPISVFLTLLAAVGVARAEVIVASPWVDFREARVRLIAPREAAKGSTLRGGLEIRLVPGFKTYWRNVGDSGVPPMFNFTASTGIGPVEVRFPFPLVFDDGAGGKAWGYTERVIFPFATRLDGSGYTLDLKLDFAVCGTMCIPLGGEMRLDPATAVAVSPEEAQVLGKTRATLPTIVEAGASPPVDVERQTPADPPVWRVRLPYAGDGARFAAFPEGNGFLEIKAVEPAEKGFLRLTIAGQAAPGSGGKFGPVRLTYGTAEAAYERMIDLDGAMPR